MSLSRQLQSLASALELGSPRALESGLKGEPARAALVLSILAKPSRRMPVRFMQALERHQVRAPLALLCRLCCLPAAAEDETDRQARRKEREGWRTSLACGLSAVGRVS